MPDPKLSAPVIDKNALQIYSDAINRPEITPEQLPPHPPQFMREPDVRGTPEFAKMVDLLMQRVPSLKYHVKRVVQGPDDSTIAEMVRSKFNPDEYNNTNLLGTTDAPTRSKVTISPRWDERDGLLSTLSHEFMHAGGKQDEAGAQAGEAVMQKALGLHDRTPTKVKQLPMNLLEELLQLRMKGQ